MAAWVVWLIAAVGLAGVEALTLTAAAGLLGAAAVVASGAAAIGLPVPLQLVVFAVAAVAAIAVVRPAARRHMLRSSPERFGVDALLGRPAYVVDEVSDRAGTVRIGGEDWTARALGDDLVIPAGTAVDVIRIDGATAVVYPRE